MSLTMQTHHHLLTYDLKPLDDSTLLAWVMEIGKSQRPAAESWIPLSISSEGTLNNSTAGPGPLSNNGYSYMSEFMSFLSTWWWKFHRQTAEMNRFHSPTNLSAHRPPTKLTSSTRCVVLARAEVLAEFKQQIPVASVLPGLAGLGGGFDICEAHRWNKPRRAVSYFGQKRRWTAERFAITDNEEVQLHYRGRGKVRLRMRTA